MTAHDNDQGGLSRRTLLQAGLATAGAATIGIPEASAQGGFDWKRFKGEKLEIVLQKSPYHDVVQKFEPEFTELTGIQIASEQIPEQQYRQKLAIEFASGKPSFDGCYVAQATQKRMFGKGKWLADLRPLIADASMTAPDFDFADFAKAAIEAGTQSDGRLDTLPLTNHLNILMVNKELLQKRNIAVPNSFAALADAATKANDPGNGISGFVGRGLKNANTPLWTGFLLGYGIDAIEASGKFNTDGPEAIAAAELYRKLVKDCGPPGSAGFNWYECQANFMQGRAAMWLDTATVGAPVADPKKSRVAAQAGFAVMPPGPKVHRAPVFASGVGIAATSKKVGPTWYWVQWMTGKQMQMRQVGGGHGASGRISPYEAARKAQSAETPSEWLDAVIASTKIAYPVLPDIVAANEFRDVFGVALTNMLADGDPATELRKATETFKPIYERTEKA